MISLLLACALGDSRTISVDLIELNHHYDRRCQLVYSQVILWRVDASDGKLHNCGWRIIKQGDEPYRCGQTWRYKSERVSIVAKHYRESWSHVDPEREDTNKFWHGEPPNVFCEEK